MEVPHHIAAWLWLWLCGILQVRVPAVRDVHVMTLTWCLPSLLHKYKTKPDDYLGHLIGHEARGSILYLLKQRGLATGLTAGVSDDGAENSTERHPSSRPADVKAHGWGACILQDTSTRGRPGRGLRRCGELD